MYPEINGTLVGDNLMELFVYANSVTNSYFVLFIVVSFFLVILLSSVLFQIRFTSRVKFETSLLASSFATLGFAVIIEQYSGLLNKNYFFAIIGILILSFMWVAFGSKD